MKKIITCFQVLLLMPVMASAQVPEQVEEAVESTRWPLSELVPMIGWPIVVFLLIFALCFFGLIPLKKRKPSLRKKLGIVLPVVIWSIWYFYPCVDYKGTYVATFEWVSGEEKSVVVIDDQFHLGKDISAPYHINPFQRMLWVETPYLFSSEFPVKLRWNKIIVPMFKLGWVEHEKIKANQNTHSITASGGSE